MCVIVVTSSLRCYCYKLVANVTPNSLPEEDLEHNSKEIFVDMTIRPEFVGDVNDIKEGTIVSYKYLTIAHVRANAWGYNTIGAPYKLYSAIYNFIGAARSHMCFRDTLYLYYN